MRKSPAMDLKRRLTEKELDELGSLMATRDPDSMGPMQASVTQVHGFLTCIVSGPIVMPSEWIPVVFGDDESASWETIDQARHAMSLLMRLYNEVASGLGRGGGRFSIFLDRIGSRPHFLDLADGWCKGYALGMALRGDEWKEAMEVPELQTAFRPILMLAHPKMSREFDPFDNPERHAAVLDALPVCAVEIYEWFRKKLVAAMQQSAEPLHASTVRRAVPKVSANAACPCGSGKKYKRCCSPLRAV